LAVITPLSATVPELVMATPLAVSAELTSAREMLAVLLAAMAPATTPVVAFRVCRLREVPRLLAPVVRLMVETPAASWVMKLLVPLTVIPAPLLLMLPAPP
jgi:hypothetical protein